MTVQVNMYWYLGGGKALTMLDELCEAIKGSAAQRKTKAKLAWLDCTVQPFHFAGETSKKAAPKILNIHAVGCEDAIKDDMDLYREATIYAKCYNVI